MMGHLPHGAGTDGDRLLACLEHLGLIHGPVKGAPNAWQLTARGRHVEQAIRVHTTAG